MIRGDIFNTYRYPKGNQMNWINFKGFNLNAGKHRGLKRGGYWLEIYQILAKNFWIPFPCPLIHCLAMIIAHFGLKISHGKILNFLLTQS